MNAKPYPKYKPSGVEWLGDVPEHWEVKPLKFFLVRNDGGVWGEDEVDEDGTIVLRSTEQTAAGDWKIEDPARRKLSLSESRYCRLATGDLVVTKSSGSEHHIGKTSLVTDEVSGLGACYSNFMQRLRCSASLNPKIAFFYLNSPAGRLQGVVKSSTSTGLANLNGTTLGGILLAVPPFHEQQAIADFLDDRTAKLDALLERKRALIGKLKEKRSALISRTVTKGLPPEAAAKAGLTVNLKFKPSGTPWLGDIPERWDVKKLSWLFSYGKGREAATLTKEYVGANPGEYPVYSGQTANEGLMGEIDTYEFDFDVPVILVTTVGAKAMTTRLVTGKLSLSQNCALIIPRSNDVVTYFYEAVLQRLFDYEKGSISLIMQPSLRFEDLDRFHVPFMSFDEQLAIAAYLGLETSKIDRMIQKVETAIEKLTEYRTSLITAAVTGKIDVRNVA